MTDQSNKPKARTRWWIAGAVVLLAVVVTAGWWLAGRRVWTDDRTIRVAAADAKLREVLWTQPQLLGEEFNTEAQEYEPSLSPDGAEMYFVRGKVGKNADIYVSYRRNNEWTEPAPLDAINTADSDDVGPRLTPDGRFLLFYSDRKGGEGGYDIWAAERIDDGFAAPFNLGPQINTEFNEYNPAPTPDGKRLFFATNRKAAALDQKEPWRATIRQTGTGDYDLFVADLDEAATPEPTTQPAPASTQPAEEETSEEADEEEAGGLADALSAEAIMEALKKRVAPGGGNLIWRPSTPPATAPSAPLLVFKSATEVPGVNTPYHEGASCLSPAGDFLYFASNRPGGFGKFDLYRVRIHEGSYGTVENLGKEINTAENEADPQLAMGGFQLFFSSDRPGVHGDSYDLLSAESREVYAARQGRPLPNLGWSVWLLLAALALLLPLLLFLRGWDDRRLNLFQKCLLVSLLVHVLLTILFSAVMVSREIVNHVRKQQEMEIAVTIADSAGIDVATEVRQQISETPIDMPEPTELAQTEMPIDLPTPAELEQVNVPQSRIDPTAMAIEVPAPRVAPPTAPSEQVKVAPPVQAQATVPQVQLQPQVRVTQNEAQMQVTPADALTARAESAPAAQAAPQAVQVDVAPARVEVGSLATAADVVRPNVPAPEAIKAAPVFEPAQASAQPTVEGPQIEIAKVASQQPEAAAVQEAVVDLPRQEMAAAQGEAATVQTALPPAQRTTETLASAAEVNPRPVPQAVQVDVKPQVERSPDAIAVAPPTAQAIEKVQEAAPALAGIEQDLPAARAAQTASAADLAKAVGVPQVAARAEPVKAESMKSDALVAARQPTTRPVEVTESVKAQVAADLGVAPQSIAPTVNAKPVQVATASPAAPQATEGTVESQRQETVAPLAGARTVATNVPATAASPASPAQSLASAAAVAPRAIDLKPELPSFKTAQPLDNVDFSLPKNATPKAIARADGTPDATADAPETVASRAQVPTELSGPRKIELAAASTPSALRPGPLPDVGPSIETRPRVTDVGPAVDFRVGVAAPKLSAPAAMFQRSVEARKPILEKMGGTKQSEEAVDRALSYLARNQEPDGRWTHVAGDSKPGERGEAGPHDPACTGLAVLAFLANDHTPFDPGPYQKVVANGVDFLISIQGEDGDLRGKRTGGGADAGNMYDHGIATFALAEAALMTGDKEITEAAYKACDFIVKAQHAETGGWRYVPGEAGDTSVFGWQVMALHSAEQLGYQITEACRLGMYKYIDIASTGEHKSLGGYQPGSGATPPMTAELLFCRIMLDQEITPEQETEVSAFLTRSLPEAGNADYYGWYYGSLSLIQLQNDAWTTWNERTRETLISMQTRGGDNDGLFDGNITWRERGGRIYTTALGALTLQVYYRYLPTRGE